MGSQGNRPARPPRQQPRPPPRRAGTSPPILPIVTARMSRPAQVVRRRVVGEELGSAAELAGLTGFAVVQPVLGPFGDSPETFLATGAAPADIIGFALTVSLVPIVVLAALASTSRLAGPVVRRRVQVALVAVLAGSTATYVARLTGAGPPVRVLAAVLAGGLTATLHARWTPLRLFLRYASPTPLLLVGAFLLASPVAPLVRPSGGGGQAGGTSDLPPVLVVVLDELPTTSLMDGAGGVDAELFPNLARLADTATFYRDHSAVASLTAASVPAIVTGQLPDPGSGRAPVHRDHPDNLFSLLRRTHEVRATEWSTALCPTDLCTGDPHPIDDQAASLVTGPVDDAPRAVGRLLTEARQVWWDQVWPTADPGDGEFELAGATEAADLVRPALEFISSLGPAPEQDGPIFDYLHAPLPHQPWRLLPSGGSYDAGDALPGSEYGVWADGDVGVQLAAAARSRHVLQLQWTDRMLGTIIDRMEALGRWDDALVVVTADHGVAFDAGGLLRVPTPENQVDIAWAPLFVKSPGQRLGAVDDRPALAVDVVPTMADILGIDVNWDVDGRSLVSTAPEPGRSRPFLALDLGPGQLQAAEPGGLAVLDADGLAAVLRAGERGADPLRAWRHGRHGHLVGLPVADLGTCVGDLEATYDLPAGWSDMPGDPGEAGEPLPLWHTAVIDVDGPVDVAVSVDGVVAGWNVAEPDDAGAAVGVLLAEPVVRDATVGGAVDVGLHQVVDAPACGLRAIDA